MQVLDEAGYIQIEKGFDGKCPCTRCHLSGEGRARFLDYLAVLEQVLQKAASVRAQDESVTRDLLQPLG